MTTPATVRGRDLRVLAGMVSEDRPDLPDGEGLPPSLLAEMKDQIRCDGFVSWNLTAADARPGSCRPCRPWRRTTSRQERDLDLGHWTHYWDSQPCSYPDRTGDVRSVLKIADFYSARQWHSTGMYCDIYRPLDIAHELQLCLPDLAGRPAAAGPGRGLGTRSSPDDARLDRAKAPA